LVSMLLHTTTNNKLNYMHVELYNKIVINKKQRKISLNFQNEMHFPHLHYTSKNEMKGHECCIFF
jgi:hypothetical protein